MSRKYLSAAATAGAIVGRERPALAAALLAPARSCLPALLVLLAHFAAALLVGLGLAGGHRIDARRDDLDRQGDDIDRGLGDRADDAAGKSEREERGRSTRFMAARLADAGVTGNERSQLHRRFGERFGLRSAALRRLRRPGGSASRPTITISGTAIGVIRSGSTWSMVAEARSTSRTSRPSSVIRRRASSHAARSSRCSGS